MERNVLEKLLFYFYAYCQIQVECVLVYGRVLILLILTAIIFILSIYSTPHIIMFIKLITLWFIIVMLLTLNIYYHAFFIKATKKRVYTAIGQRKNLHPIFYLLSSFFVNVSIILTLYLSDNISDNTFSILDLSIALFIGLEDCSFTYFSSFCWLLQITAAIHKFIADNLICYRSRQCPYTRR